MKYFNKDFIKTIFVTSFCLLMLCCSKDEDEKKTIQYFDLSSVELPCSYKNPVNINAPFSGKSYKLNVKASDDITWYVEIEEGDILSVTPEGTQFGNGEIIITVAPNPDKVPDKKGVVVVKNSLNDDEYRFIVKQLEKKLEVPKFTMIQQDSASFRDETSRFNYRYMRESDNVAVFWERTLGTNPQTAQRPFDPDKLLLLAEEVFAFIKYELHFCNVENSVTDRFKVLIYVIDDGAGGATGGGNDGKGELAIRPHHVGNPNMVYHEVAHSFQYMSGFDGGKHLAGGVYEMASQWTLLRRSPNWIDQEYNHFQDYINEYHLSLGCSQNQYRNPYMYEYWATKRGVDVIGRLFLNAADEDDGDIMNVYKRLYYLNQETFNAEIYDAATKFMTWDLPYIEKAYAARGANAHTCELKKIGVTYRITKEKCPGNYSYNGIKLTVPEAGTTVTVNFRGIISSNEFEIQKPELAQWRYGFVAVKKDGSRIYGDPTVLDIGKASLTVPEDTEHLWLVVAATPKEHFRIGGKNQWPYQFTLDNTEPDGVKCRIIN